MVGLTRKSVSFNELPGLADGSHLLARGSLDAIFPSNAPSTDNLVEKRKAFPCLLTSQHLELLAAQQAGWGASDLSIDNARALGHSNTFCVVTGQQPGLLLGPLFTLFKILTAVSMAKRIQNANQGIRVVPVFWNASADSDLEEVDTACLLNLDGQPSSFRLDMKHFEEGTTIASLPIETVEIDAICDWVQQTSPKTEFVSDILCMLQQTHRESKRYSEWFNRILHRLLPESGMVIFEGALVSTKASTRSIWTPYFQEQGRLLGLLERSENRLAKIGLGTRLRKWQEDTGWFIVRNGIRHAVQMRGESLYAQDERISSEWIAESDEIELKPGAALRPIVQDFLLPNLVTVVGPHELEYHAQLGPIYEDHGVSRPRIVHRFTGAIVEKKVSRFLENNQMEPQDLAKPQRELEKRLFRESKGQTLAHWKQRAHERIEDLFDELDGWIDELGEDLKAPVHKRRHKVLQQVDSLEDLLVRRASQRDKVLLGRLEKARTALFPENGLQERVLSPFTFMVKYGTEIVALLEESVSSNAAINTSFHFVYIL